MAEIFKNWAEFIIQLAKSLSLVDFESAQKLLMESLTSEKDTGAKIFEA